MSIAIAGTGYVGLSLAVLLAQHNEVSVVDVVPEKIEMLKSGKSPIADEEIEDYLAHRQLRLIPTLDARKAYADAEMVIIATPTDYDPDKLFFDTSHVEEVVDLVLESNPEAVMVIKSTVPVGCIRGLTERYPEGRFLFSPEFLREGRALYDNLHPSRIIVGVPSEPPLSPELRIQAPRLGLCGVWGPLQSCQGVSLEHPPFNMTGTEMLRLKHPRMQGAVAVIALLCNPRAPLAEEGR